MFASIIALLYFDKILPETPFQEACFNVPAFNQPPMTLKLFRKAACDHEHCSKSNNEC